MIGCSRSRSVRNKAGMITHLLSADSPRAIPQAMDILKSGGLVAFPTDTIYGIGALAFDGAAVESIYAAKNRPVEKAIPVLMADIEDLERVAAGVPRMAEILARKFWPGPLTLLIPKHARLPQSVSANSTVGVRIPDHPFARVLLRAAGPLAATSANISGRSGPSRADEVFQQLSGRIPLILDGGPTPGGMASTVVDCTGSEPVILRQGPVSREHILAVLKQDS